MQQRSCFLQSRFASRIESHVDMFLLHRARHPGQPRPYWLGWKYSPRCYLLLGVGHMPTRDKDSIGVRVELLFNAELINQITDIRRSLREGGAPISANGKGKKR